MTEKKLTHAGCVVFRNDEDRVRFLVISSSTGEHWVLPKGHIDPGETPETTALRELMEETGVLGEIIRPLSVQSFDINGKQVVIQYFLVRMTGSKEASENRELLWKELKDAREKLSFIEGKQALKDTVDSKVLRI
ncbi:MAG TPA: NUDIX domain-containing protein [Anaerolineales bacterium]|nr:NUDIX domain-containing protein [Anaerolineales bacterium]